MTTENGPSDAVDGTARRKSRLPVLLTVLAVSLALLGAVTFTLPYYGVAPGVVLPVDDLIEVPEDRAFPSAGTISLTTVSLRSLTAFEAARGWLHPEIDVVPAPRVLGAPLSEESEKNFAEQGQLSMGQSKDLAVLAALRRLGLLTERGNGALVSAVARGSPAEGRLHQGDVIVAVNGQPTPVAGDLPAAIATRQPGEVVRLEVVDIDGASRPEEIVLGPSPGRSGGFLGVSVLTKDREVDQPFEVVVEPVPAGGASAGLAIALGVVDALTAGELTGGHRVAATGTISPDGTVGEVDGTGQKAAAARAAGNQYLLVPPGGLDAAAAHAGDSLEVLAVSTLEEALAALAELGGDVESLPAPPTPGPGG